MSEKKVIDRNVAIALGIICIILAVGLVGAIMSYSSTISGKDSTMATLNSQISSLNSQKTSLQNQVDDLNNVTHLSKSEIWVNNETISQPANSYWSFSTNNATYAGYVVVWVQNSTTIQTYVRLFYSTYVTTRVVNGHAYPTPVLYENRIDVGFDGTAVFPVLPYSDINIRVGNTDLDNGATEIVTITYYY
jgi:hypothetical protein